MIFCREFVPCACFAVISLWMEMMTPSVCENVDGNGDASVCENEDFIIFINQSSLSYNIKHRMMAVGHSSTVHR